MGGDLVPMVDIVYEGIFLFLVGFFFYLGSSRADVFLRHEWQERTQQGWGYGAALAAPAPAPAPL